MRAKTCGNHKVGNPRGTHYITLSLVTHLEAETGATRHSRRRLPSSPQRSVARKIGVRHRVGDNRRTFGVFAKSRLLAGAIRGQAGLGSLDHAGIRRHMLVSAAPKSTGRVSVVRSRFISGHRGCSIRHLSPYSPYVLQRQENTNPSIERTGAEQHLVRHPSMGAAETVDVSQRQLLVCNTKAVDAGQMWLRQLEGQPRPARATSLEEYFLCLSTGPKHSRPDRSLPSRNFLRPARSGYQWNAREGCTRKASSEQ